MPWRWRPDLSQAKRESLSIIAVGALINYKRSTWRFGLAPLGIEEDQLIESWVEVCMRITTAESPI